MVSLSDTIAAIATPHGEGGVAIIRISGPEALQIADRVFSTSVLSLPSHTVHFGSVRDLQGALVDSVLLIPMLGGRSYTGEVTVEIHCHGGVLVSRRVLETVLTAGARSAGPGEFTLRAFMNGKIDLSQAEAVQSLISAKADRALDAATDQLQGRLSAKVRAFQKELVDIAAILEAWVDFPEDDLEFASFDQIITRLTTVNQEMEELVATFSQGRLLEEGIAVCLIGAPNVGKSSLMNVLLDQERAIVTAMPGTTRDTLEASMQLNGLTIKLIDTAGIRDTLEIVEQEGIRRSHQAMQRADLILLVLDATRSFHPEEQGLLQQADPKKTVVVWNKIDIMDGTTLPPTRQKAVRVSAKTGAGLETLTRAIDEVIWRDGAPSQEEVTLTNIRHKEAVQAAIVACQRTIDGLQTVNSPEFVCIDLRDCLQSLGTIIGTDVTEDILTAIFSKFCLGK